MMDKSPTHRCLNCGSGFEYNFEYCPSCGQKNTDGKITFRELWIEFQDAIFNIDSQTWKTFINIFVPGKLTLEYFAGKHRQYVHPLRLLIVTSLLTIFALSFQDVQSSTNHPYVIKDRILENYERQRVNRILKNIVHNTNTAFPEQKTEVITDTILNVFHDSLYSLLHKYGDKYGDYIDLNTYVNFGGEDSEIISKHDFLTKTEDELVKKYKKDAGVLERLFFRQKIKYIKDESQLTSGMMGRITWAIMLMMPCVALVFYFLYIRRRFYFIENLIFTFHLHAFFFIVATILILGWFIFPTWVYYLSTVLIQMFLFISMWKVYGQSIFKTLLKLIILNISYLILFILFFTGTSLISFLLL